MDNEEKQLEAKMKIIAEKNYSIAESSEKIGMSPSWFRQKISQREIKFLRLGGRIFITGETLINLMRDAVVLPK